MRAMLDNSLVFGVYSPTPSPPPASADLDVDATLGSTRDPATTLHEIAESVHKPASVGGQGWGHGQGQGQQSQPSGGGGGEPSLIGFARAITDRVTFFYLTDVYMLPDWQGQGLGKWLIQCVQEVVEDMPYLRRSMCVVGHGREDAQAFYGKLMKMEQLGEDTVPLHWRGPGCTF